MAFTPNTNHAVRLRVAPGKSSYIEDMWFAANQDIGATTSYYQLVAKTGDWQIIKEVISGTVTTWTYAFGASDAATNWANRASLTYAAAPTALA